MEPLVWGKDSIDCNTEEQGEDSVWSGSDDEGTVAILSFDVAMLGKARLCCSNR